MLPLVNQDKDTNQLLDMCICDDLLRKMDGNLKNTKKTCSEFSVITATILWDIATCGSATSPFIIEQLGHHGHPRLKTKIDLPS